MQISRVLGSMLFVWAGLAMAPAARADWVGAWGASPSGADSTERFVGETFRQTVHLNGGGDAIRLRLGNALGNSALILGGVTVAAPAAGGPAEAGQRGIGPADAVTFAGRSVVTIPPYATIVSDPLPRRVASGADLVVSLLVASSKAPSEHELGSTTAYVAPGDQASAVVLHDATTRDIRIVLSGIDVEGKPGAGTIVALGDSITDGFRSTPDLDRRWPDLLARRLKAAPSLGAFGIVNAGISGNRLLRDGAGPSALSRLPRDVLALPGLRFVCLLEGINDIAAGALATEPADKVTAADIVGGYLQVVAQAHEHRRQGAHRHAHAVLGLKACASRCARR